MPPHHHPHQPLPAKRHQHPSPHHRCIASASPIHPIGKQLVQRNRQRHITVQTHPPSLAAPAKPRCRLRRPTTLRSPSAPPPTLPFLAQRRTCLSPWLLRRFLEGSRSRNWPLSPIKTTRSCSPRSTRPRPAHS